jgi:magnesium-transporting ATPase (P-type)
VAGEERARNPFDPRRRRMTVIVGDRVLVKGAPDAVLPVCGRVAGAEEAYHALAGRGLRTLAVAWRPWTGDAPARAVDVEQGLELLGLLGLEDPPRPEVREAIEACRASGIRVIMVTGDHPATAEAVADEVGLLDHGRLVVAGADLPADDAAIGDLLDREGVVVARVAPEDKLRIARALQGRGHVVAMTGDGVNDGPALREADIGVAMGRSGSDVAREAADLVLLDDDFATIVAAVEQGRGTFLNIRRFLTYHLTDNVAELFPLVVWALSGTRYPLALGVMQILALDLATDTLSAVALGGEQPHGKVMRRPPVAGRLLDRVVAWRSFGLLGPLEALTAMGAFLCVFLAAGWRPGESFPGGAVLAAASGAYFLTVVTMQSANSFACRSSTIPPHRLGWFSNRLLVWAMSTELAFAMLLLYLPWLADVLGHEPPGVVGWTVALAAVPLLFLVDAVDKRVRYRLRHRGEGSVPRA